MSNADSETTKSKRKNDEQLTVSRKRWRRVLIRLNALMLLLLFIIINSQEVILTSSTPSEVDSVDYYHEYRDGEVREYLTIRCHDMEGDISKFTMEVFRHGQNFGAIAGRDITTRPSMQRHGTVMNTWFICDSHRTNITIFFTDQQRNESNHFTDSIRCYTPDILSIIQTEVAENR
jgi:hypothetical protein